MLPLKRAVLEPDALNSCAVTHPIFAKQFTLLIPLPAHAVELPVLIRFFRREHSVLVPGACDAMPSAISQPHFFANLAVPIKTSLDGGAHNACAVCPLPTPPFDGIKQGSRSNAKSELFTFTKRRGANPTCSREGHREAPGEGDTPSRARVGACSGGSFPK